MKQISRLLLAVMLVISAKVACGEQAGRITGRLLAEDGTPVQSGMLYLYRRSSAIPFAPDKYRFDPDQVGSIRRNGAFSLRVEAGDYYLEAVQRDSSQGVGPPQINEPYLIGRDDAGRPEVYTVEPGGDLDIGDLTGAVPYAGLRPDAVPAGISGKVFDSSGEPAAGVVVFAFLQPEMTGKAAFISDKTGQDGSYLIGIASSGTFYLRALDLMRFPPEIHGIHGSDQPVPIKVEAGRIVRGVDIGR